MYRKSGFIVKNTVFIKKDWNFTSRTRFPRGNSTNVSKIRFYIEKDRFYEERLKFYIENEVF